MPLVGYDPKDDDRGRRRRVLYDWDLFDALADPLVVLLVVLLVLVKVIFFSEEPEHSGGPLLELVEHGPCFGLF